MPTSQDVNRAGGWRPRRPFLSGASRAAVGGRWGFTLVEILVSVTILMVLLAVFGQMLNSTTKAWGLGGANAERLQNARAINDFIVDELQAALLPVNRADQASLQLVVNPAQQPAIPGTIYGNRDAIFWQAPLATNQALGEIAEIGYFVAWDTTTNLANPRASLYRFFANPVQAGTAATPEPDFLIHANPAGWLSDALVKRVVPAVNFASTGSYQGLFAENVIGLWVTCLDSGAVPITEDADGDAFTTGNFPSGTGYDSRRGYRDSAQAGTPVRRLPAMIDLSFVLIDSSAAAKITPALQTAIIGLYEQASDANHFVSLAQADSENRFAAIKSSLRSYQTRIFLQNAQ